MKLCRTELFIAKKNVFSFDKYFKYENFFLIAVIRQKIVSFGYFNSKHY